MEKISIITAIHNGIAFNKIYLASLQQNTYNPFELIIIDNCSTDGSKELFKNAGAIVIENSGNYSYPHCQNQGIKAAGCDYLYFLNNDLVVSPGWDKRLMEISRIHGLDLISAKGVENMGSRKLDRAFNKRWKKSKYLLMPFGFGETNLRLMHKLMYGNWEKFCEKQYREYGNEILEGILGNNVMLTRKAIEKIGFWDERIQSADFDLFIRAKKYSIEFGDIKPCHVALGVYIHHFIRMTSKYGKKKPVPFEDKDTLISLFDKWSQKEIELYGIPENK